MQTLLQQTQAAFKAYRTVNPRGRYRDDKLKQQAVACLDQHSLGDVANTLLLDRKTLRLWQAQLASAASVDAAKTQNTFMPIALSSIASDTSNHTQAPTIKLTLPSGIMLTLEHYEPTQAVQLINAISKEAC